MSRLKKIDGRLTFDDAANVQEFEKTIDFLEKGSRRSSPRGERNFLGLGGRGNRGREAENPAVGPFIVTLTFEEAYTKPFWDIVKENFAKLEEVFLQVASTAAAGVTPVKFLADVASEFLKKFAQSTTTSPDQLHPDQKRTIRKKLRLTR